METICHRCGATLHSPDIYCPVCGSPQLRVLADDEGANPANGGAGEGHPAFDSRLISWRTAVKVALLVALPVGALSSLLNFGVLWVIAGGIAAVALYRRKTLRLVNQRAGWRIGGLAGILAAFIATVFDGLTMLFERYVQHNGAVIDQRLQTLVQQATDHMVQSNPEAAAQIPWFIHFWLSPDGHAAVVLMMAIFSAVSMALFSAVGGAVGARFFAAKTSAAHNS